MGKLRVSAITRQDYMPFLIDVHYAARCPSVSFAFGLFVNDRLEGVVTYGTPASSTLRSGIAGPDYAGSVIELNRLCLLGNTKNHASYLVAASLRGLSGNKIVVSFADMAQGHVGYVYQACNFLYSGLSAKRTDWAVKGKEKLHGQTISDEFRGVKNRANAMREKYGDDFYLKPRSRKHRYIYIIGDKRFKRNARKSLLYKISPYPKGATNA